MKKKLLAWILSIMMVVSLLPMTAMAADGEVTEVDTYDDLVTAVQSSGIVKLTGNIEFSGIYNNGKTIKIPNARTDSPVNVVLDLNGYTLGQTTTSSGGTSAAAIAIRPGSTLTVKDSSANQTGAIEACNCAFQNEGTLIMESGKILIGKSASGADLSDELGFAYGVWMYMLDENAPAPTFTMTGGSIEMYDRNDIQYDDTFSSAVACGGGADGIGEYYDDVVISISNGCNVEGNIVATVNNGNITVPATIPVLTVNSEGEILYTVTYTDGVPGRTIFPDQTYFAIMGANTPAFVGSFGYQGYEFTGWSPVWSETVTGNVTYVAQWRQTYFQIEPIKPVKPVTPVTPVVPVEPEVEDDSCDGKLSSGCAAATFADLDSSAWYHDAVDYALENGLMQGTGDNKFAPYTTTSRAMIVTILYRLEGEPTVFSENPFADVKNGEWYTDAIIWAAENEIVLGYDGEFFPEDDVTAEQALLILQRYAEYKGEDEGITVPMIAPYEYSTWAEAGVVWAYLNDILEIGTDLDDLTAPATRVELAAFLYAFCK